MNNSENNTKIKPNGWALIPLCLFFFLPIAVNISSHKLNRHLFLFRTRNASLWSTGTLIASGIATGVRPMDIVPHLYYPFLIGIIVILSIVFQYPRKYTQSGTYVTILSE